MHTDTGKKTADTESRENAHAQKVLRHRHTGIHRNGQRAQYKEPEDTVTANGTETGNGMESSIYTGKTSQKGTVKWHKRGWTHKIDGGSIITAGAV